MTERRRKYVRTLTCHAVEMFYWFILSAWQACCPEDKGKDKGKFCFAVVVIYFL